MSTRKDLDRRSRRSRAAFQEAFLSLLEEHELSKITVKQIAERADRDRKTFYLHYNSIDALVDELLKKEVEEIVDAISENSLSTKGEVNVHELFEALSAEILIGINSKSSLMRHVDTDWLVSKMQPILTAEIIERDSLNLAQILGPYLEPLTSFFCGGLLSLYHHWSAADSQLSLETMASLGSAALVGGISCLREEALSLKLN